MNLRARMVLPQCDAMAHGPIVRVVPLNDVYCTTGSTRKRRRIKIKATLVCCVWKLWFFAKMNR
jgi:hypothetical protein